MTLCTGQSIGVWKHSGNNRECKYIKKDLIRKFKENKDVVRSLVLSNQARKIEPYNGESHIIVGAADSTIFFTTDKKTKERSTLTTVLWYLNVIQSGY